MERLVEPEFAEFFAAYRAAVYRALLVATGQPAASEDAMAEAFARAYQRWPVLRAHPNPTAWLICTARNVHRSSWRQRRRELPAAFVDQPEPATDGDLNEVGGPLSANLRVLVMRLPTRQRQVVALRILADLSPEETAAILNIDAGTVHAHLHRALAALRCGLSAEPQGDRS